MDELGRNVLGFIRNRDLLHDGDRAVLAFSGGPDSVALALILTALSAAGLLRLELSLAHLNHCLRGEEADREEAFCRRFAEERGLRIEVGREDVAARARLRRQSVEAAARAARYEFLGSVARSTGAGAVATAHQADDVGETVLLRILRGTGLRGLAAMPACRALDRAAGGPRVRLVRPLLGVRKAELTAFLKGTGQTFCVDGSNVDLSYARNRVRHLLIPMLEREFPSFSVESLCALNESAAEAVRLLDEMLDDLWDRMCLGQAQTAVLLDRPMLAEAPAAIRKAAAERALKVLAELTGTEPPALNAGHYEKLSGLPHMGTGARVSLPRGFAARCEHGLVLFFRGAPASALPERELPVPGQVSLPEAGVRLEAEVLPAGSVTSAEAAACAGPREAFLDLARAATPLCVRSRRPGDRFHPLGAPGPTRLKKFLIGRRVPLHERDLTPLVTDAGGTIIWVVGHRISEEHKLQAGSGRILHLRAHRAG